MLLPPPMLKTSPAPVAFSFSRRRTLYANKLHFYEQLSTGGTADSRASLERTEKPQEMASLSERVMTVLQPHYPHADRRGGAGVWCGGWSSANDLCS